MPPARRRSVAARRTVKVRRVGRLRASLPERSASRNLKRSRARSLWRGTGPVKAFGAARSRVNAAARDFASDEFDAFGSYRHSGYRYRMQVIPGTRTPRPGAGKGWVFFNQYGPTGNVMRTNLIKQYPRKSAWRLFTPTVARRRGR